MIIRIFSAKMMPMAVMARPLTMAVMIEVCTILLTLSNFFAPYSLAAATFEPMERPTKRFVRRFISAVFEPTAARELSPAKRPTTTMSAALNKSCNIPEHISGRVNISIFFRIEPLHISISYFAFSAI